MLRLESFAEGTTIAGVQTLCRTLCVLAVATAVAHGENNVVNLSHYDEMSPDFSKMAKSGIVGVIHEATYPSYQHDARYGGRRVSATGAGLLWGAYHFADSSDPVRQADHFLGSVASRGSGTPTLLVLDFEKNDHYPGGTMTVDEAATFVERIKQKTGNYPGLYASENRIKGVINGTGARESSRRSLANCWLWIANYHAKPAATAPWRGWTFWQYTGDGVCELPRSAFPIGIANIRKAERNIFSGSNAALRSFWNSHAWQPGS